MTREEAINMCMEVRHYLTSGNPIWDNDKVGEALDIAIEALNREQSEDGTLKVKVEDATKIGRVLITDGKHRGGLYYPDEDEPQKSYPTEWCEQCTLWEDNKCIGVAQCRRNIDALKQVMNEDLISRAEAIEAITETLDAIDHVPKWVFDKLTSAIDILPSADRSTDGDLISRSEAIEAMGEEPPVWCDDDAEIAERNQWRTDVEAIKSVPSADRPKGEWLESREQNILMAKRIEKGETWRVCSNCGTGFMIGAQYEGQKLYGERFHNFCPRCGADMRPTERSEE